MLTRRTLLRGALAALLWPRSLWAQPFPPSDLQVSQSGKMGRLFTCGFEENNLTATMWTQEAGTAGAIVTDQVHSGTYAYKPPIGDSGTALRRNRSASIGSGTHWFRVYVRTSNGWVRNNLRIFWIEDSGSVPKVSVRAMSDETLRLVNEGTGTTSASSTVLSLDTWYRLELRVLVHATAAEIELRIFLGDTTSPLETLTPITGEAMSDFEKIVIGKSGVGAGDNTSTMWFDDLAYNDSTGTFQNSWPGPGNIALAVPGGEIAMAWEDETSGVSLYTNVNDLPGTPDDANYNMEDDTLNVVDRMTLATLPAGIPADADMVLLDLYARVGSNQTSANRGRLKIWDEGSNLTDGPNVDFNYNGWALVTTAEHQVYDLGTRTKANVQDFDIGYETILDLATRPRRISALWANVEWIAAAAGGLSIPVAMQSYRQRRVLV